LQQLITHIFQIFADALPLTGIILTKTDGDARGGAALSVRHITGKPIKFLGVGEKVDALEPFHPDRIVSRLLGMGDVLSLIEEIGQKVDHKKAEKAGSMCCILTGH
jgi:signal recognition particle subunit SRP54